jgi:hypothetical protein
VGSGYRARGGDAARSPESSPSVIRCFMLEQTTSVRLWLRRYVRQHSGAWNCAEGWHEAMVLFADAPAIFEERMANGGWKHTVVLHGVERPPDDDPRWPTQCGKCAFVFAPADEHQLFYDQLYARVDTGEIVALRDAPPGAMWDGWWLHGLSGGALCGPTVDGRNLFVRLPNGRDWHIDGRASNCTMPKDDVHHCWIRHGNPPDLMVDKNGVTCAAGAGSIQAGDYHGFLGQGGAPPGHLT